MGIFTSVERLATYYKRHGLWATVQRFTLEVRRSLFSGHQVVFHCDLADYASHQQALPISLRVERKKDYSELSLQDLHEIVSFWNPTLAQRNIEERLAKEASLWLIKSEGRLAGYGWTSQGRTIAPHYFPLGSYDVHFFDFYVFPQYRGRGINPLLVTHILHSLAADSRGRAFIEAAEWNEAQLSSLAKTPFHRLGWVRMVTVFGRTIVWWEQREGLQDYQKQMGKTPLVASPPRRNSA
jgi:ribosomal protein S18 acetylase RimI-like enzyme